LEKIVQANGVDICVDTFGDSADPAVLLIAGAASSMLFWEDEFCARLAAGPRFVIRYDSRDMGRSVSYPPGAPDYSFGDLARDAVGVLDALRVDRAHVVGISMGGGLSQILGMAYPDRVRTLTLIATSPGGPGAADLPPMSAETIAHFTGSTPPDLADRDALIDHTVEELRWFAGSPDDFDAAATREFVRRDLERTTNIESSMQNHMAMKFDEPWRGRLAEVTAPTLVLHGDHDPLFPLEHGIALAKEIPTATLVTLPMGHELPRSVWDAVVPAILDHTS
jgi:pimeloyl-ACP methyl ester carboxylesterase